MLEGPWVFPCSVLGLWAVREESPMGRCQRTESVLFLLSSTGVSASASLLSITIPQSCTSHLIQHRSAPRASAPWFSSTSSNTTLCPLAVPNCTTTCHHFSVPPTKMAFVFFFFSLSKSILSFFHH